MEEEFKKEVWKVFSVAAFLFITIFFVLPYLIQTSTYFHEKAHVKALAKYGVKGEYEVDWLSSIPNFFNPHVDKLGVTRFSLEEYKKLNKFERTEVNVAGIVSDLTFLFLICVYLTFGNIYMFYKLRIQKNFEVKWALAINWLLFMWLLALIQITIANLTYSSGDLYQLVNLLKVP